MQFLPKDLTPLQRARLKLISHFILIFVFNMGLAVYVYFTSAPGMYNWYVVAYSAAAQGALALLDALRKYYSAQGDLPLSTAFELAQKELAVNAPPAPPMTVNEQAIAQTVAALLAPQLKPIVMQPNPTVAATSAQPMATTNAALPLGSAISTGGMYIPPFVASPPVEQNTLPTIKAITPQ